jgi:hypothetical protein
VFPGVSWVFSAWKNAVISDISRKIRWFNVAERLKELNIFVTVIMFPLLRRTTSTT